MKQLDLTYGVRPYEASDQPAVLHLLERSLGGGPTGQRSAEFFEWKHERNPYGRSIATVAELDGEIIGFRTFMRWTFQVGDEVIPAVRAVDTATDPEHQGKGIFRRLTLETLDLVREQAAFVFNTPNEQSLPGYLKFGWREVGVVPLRIRVCRPLRFALQFRKAGAARGASTPVASFLPTAGEILEDEAAIKPLLDEAGDGRLATLNTLTTLRWRFAEAPGLDYRAVPVMQGGSLVGLGIGRLRTRGPLTEFGLALVLARPGDTASVRRVLASAAKAGGDYVITHLDNTLDSTARSAAYLAAPGRGMTLTVNPLRSTALHPAEMASWRLALGDLEVF